MSLLRAWTCHPVSTLAGTFRSLAASNDGIALDSSRAMQVAMSIHDLKLPYSTMSYFMNRRIILSAVAFLIGIWLISEIAPSGGRTAQAGEIGWIEDFSLATDRTVPLKQLIPGTEDYYYYYCLHYQTTEQWDKVDATLKAWVDRYNYTPRAIEIENRQALLTYKQNPRAGAGADPQSAQPAVQSPARGAEPKAESADEARSGHHLARAAQPAGVRPVSRTRCKALKTRRSIGSSRVDLNPDQRRQLCRDCSGPTIRIWSS